MTRSTRLCVLAFSSALLLGCVSGQAEHFENAPVRMVAMSGQRKAMSSPNGKITADFVVDELGSPTYNIKFNGLQLIAPSRLGLVFANSPELRDFFVSRFGSRKEDSEYRLPIGKSKTAIDRYNEFSFELQERKAPSRKLVLSFRLYDDGIGFRYVIPKQDGVDKIELKEELTTFELVGNPMIYAVRLPFNSTFEGYYSKGKLSELAGEKTLNAPILARVEKKGPWLAISEAGLVDYAGMYLAAQNAKTLAVRLDPSKTAATDEVKVRAVTPFASPWRVIMIGSSASELLESNIINNLNEPTAIQDTSWIHPGKIIFPWWSDYALDVDPGDHDPEHKPGLNTWSLKKYIDFCAENKIEYFSFDGFNQAWYGGDIGNPPLDVDVTKAIPAIDMPGVLSYAKEKGVRARLWMHKDALLRAPSLDDVFSTYERWGIEGVMIDFLNADDQETVQSYMKMIKAAARHHLTINFHGSWKPTGVSRTYPNLLSQEAVISSEKNRFTDPRAKSTNNIASNDQGSLGCTPEHEATYTWIRQLAGPTDIHPGSFNPVLPENFDADKDGLRAMGTLARQLALYVVVESGLPMVSDAPREYLKRPVAFEFVKAVPAAWDETRFVAGAVGESTVVARRSGEDWYLGAITDRHARKIELSLAFLGKGKYMAEVYADGPNTKTHADDVAFKSLQLVATDRFMLDLAASGGCAIYFKKVR
jgi:alpha-glucosidase